MECEQKDCNNEATMRMFWPSEPPTVICPKCWLKASQISKAMGFYLHIEALPEQVEQEAKEEKNSDANEKA